MNDSTDGPVSQAAMTGSLEAIPLFDICQFLLLNRRTGTLTVRRDSQVVRIYFEEGMILDITDEGLRSGEKVLLGAVQWRDGTFAFDPTPTGVQRKIEDSTEAILLEAARTIDEYRARAGEEGEQGPSQETIFRERQTFAGELAEAFRTAIEPAGRSGGSSDPIQALLDDLQRTGGALLLRGRTAILRVGRTVRPHALGFGAAELLQRLHLPVPAAGEVRNHRFEKPPGWFHLRSRIYGGELQIFLANLASELPRPQEIGLDPGLFEPLLDREGGLILWTGMPHGYRSTALSCWLGHSNGAARGLTLWLEEVPRVAWEVASWISRHVGEPHGLSGPEGLLEWDPDLLVVDPARVGSSARLALEMAEAGITTIAVGTGVGLAEGVERFLSTLGSSGMEEAPRRLGRALSAWVGVLPLNDREDDPPLVATQVVRPDAELASALARGGAPADLRRWEQSCRPVRAYTEEVERLRREGRLDPDLYQRLKRDLPGLEWKDAA